MQQPLVEFELTKEFRDRFQEALDKRDLDFIRKSLEDVKPADITTLLYEFIQTSRSMLWTCFRFRPRLKLSATLTPIRAKFLKSIHAVGNNYLLNELASDDTADILNELPIKEREQVLSGLENKLRIQVTELLRYEANVAGGLMAKELIKARYTGLSWNVSKRSESRRRV